MHAKQQTRKWTGTGSTIFLAVNEGVLLTLKK
jgi:hypothetical protein